MFRTALTIVAWAVLAFFVVTGGILASVLGSHAFEALVGAVALGLAAWYLLLGLGKWADARACPRCRMRLRRDDADCDRCGLEFCLDSARQGTRGPCRYSV
jgi:hypothetical protein